MRRENMIFPLMGVRRGSGKGMLVVPNFLIFLPHTFIPRFRNGQAGWGLRESDTH